MTSTAIAAPALSTAQDEEETFAKVEGLNDELLREKRKHLGPKYTENLELTYDEINNIISDYYSIEKLAKYLNQRTEEGILKFQSISLQFPDNLICDSTIVAQILQNLLNKWNKEYHDNVKHHNNKEENNEIDFNNKFKSSLMNRDIESVEKTINKKSSCNNNNCGLKCKNRDKFYQDVWILADTSYSPCCIDEVAANHVNSDIVIHFGDACLNPVNKIQSCYVFGKPYLNLDKIIEIFENNYQDKDEKIVLMADSTYSYHLNEIFNKLKNERDYNNLVIANIDYEKSGNKCKIIDGYNRIDFGNNIKIVNRILTGFNKEELNEFIEFNINDEEEGDRGEEESCKFDQFTQEYSLFHLTRPHDSRILELTTKFKEIKIVDIENFKIIDDQLPTMMKRYRNMQITRTASTIGILVNTLSLFNTKKLLNQIIKSVIEAGKKHYMFVVGKPNVAKLANFDCIDVWCIIGCGQSGIVIDLFGDYFKPIITPYELKLALMPQVTWTGKWVTDFIALIEHDETEGKENENKQDIQEVDEFAPEYDPVTGTLKMNQPLRQLRHLELELEHENDKRNYNNTDQEDSLVKKFSGTLAVGNTVSTSALKLQERQWSGLGSDFNDQQVSPEGALVEDGRTGIARGYNE